MAFEETQDEENLNNPANPNNSGQSASSDANGQVQIGPSAGVVSGTGGAASGSSPNFAGQANAAKTGYTNLQSYLDQNSDQVGGLASKITDPLNQQVSQIKSDTATDAGNFKSDVDKGTVQLNSDLTSGIQGGGSYTPPSTSENATPTDVANQWPFGGQKYQASSAWQNTNSYTPKYDPSQLTSDQTAQLKAMRDASYTGPTDSSSYFSPTQTEYSTLAQNAQNLNTESGRYQLLDQAVNNPNYTQGQRYLDQALLSGNPQTQGTFSNLSQYIQGTGADAGSGLGDYINGQIQAVNPYLQSAQATTQNTHDVTNQALQNAQTSAWADLQNRVQMGQASANDAYKYWTSLPLDSRTLINEAFGPGSAGAGYVSATLPSSTTKIGPTDQYTFGPSYQTNFPSLFPAPAGTQQPTSFKNSSYMHVINDLNDARLDPTHYFQQATPATAYNVASTNDVSRLNALADLNNDVSNKEVLNDPFNLKTLGTFNPTTTFDRTGYQQQVANYSPGSLYTHPDAGHVEDLMATYLDNNSPTPQNNSQLFSNALFQPVAPNLSLEGMLRTVPYIDQTVNGPMSMPAAFHLAPDSLTAPATPLPAGSTEVLPDNPPSVSDPTQTPPWMQPGYQGRAPQAPAHGVLTDPSLANMTFADQAPAIAATAPTNLSQLTGNDIASLANTTPPWMQQGFRGRAPQRVA